MNKLFLLFIVLSTVITASAQDKIITINNDTIHCRIVSINDVAIRYEEAYGGKVVVGKLIPLDKVAEYYRLPGKNSTSVAVEKPWQWAFSTGGGYMPWLLKSFNEAGIYNECRKVQSGVQFMAQAHYFVNQSIGLGMQYSFFTSGINGDLLTEINSIYPIYTYSYQRERHYLNYAGVSVLFQQTVGTSRKLFLTETISGGMLLYRGESQSSQFLPNSSGYFTMRQNSLIEGATVGAGVGISAGYRILPDLTIGTGLDLLYGRLRKVDFSYRDSRQNQQEGDGFELDSPLNFSRINYSIVLRYTLN